MNEINECIECKLISLTYKVLPTSPPDYLHNLFSLHVEPAPHLLSVVTLARPSISSSLQITNRSFRYASPHLWNQLPSSFRQPHSVHSPPGSPHHSYYLRSHHLSLPRPFTPDLKLISFTNLFLHSHSYSSRNSVTDFVSAHSYSFFFGALLERCQRRRAKLLANQRRPGGPVRPRLCLIFRVWRHLSSSSRTLAQPRFKNWGCPTFLPTPTAT